MFFVAVVVDPIYKLKYVKFWFKQCCDKEKADELGLRVRDALNRLYKHHSGTMRTPCGVSASGTSESSGSDVAVMSSMLSSFVYNTIYKQHLANEDSVKCKSKLDCYLLEASEDPETEGLDILDWWRVNSSRYRVLSQVALEVFSIHVSTIASESACSTGGCVFDPFRSSLSPNTVERIQLNQLTYKSQWMNCKAMNLNRVMCLCSFLLFSTFFIYIFSCSFICFC